MMSLHSEANDADDDLVKFLEAEVLAQDVDEESQHNGQENSTSSSTKCIHLEECKLEVDIEELAENDVGAEMKSNVEASGSSSRHFKRKRYMENGPFSKIPTEIYPHIFKFLSPEDLVNCALVCRFMRAAASEESLWQRLYCMRWGLPQPDHGKLRACAWKKLYIERDTVDMMEFVRGCPVEFQEYYIQMQAAKRSDAPLRSMLKDDIMILDTTVGDQINQWKQRHGLPDVFTGGHLCSGSTCTYSQVGDIFLCEKTGFVHVCDHTCRETVVDADSQLLVCLISGRCSVHWISTAEEEVDPGHQQGDYAAGDEAEPLTGDGQLARAYLLGYNCNDEKELEDALREVIYPGSNRI
jgi:hypothetical protein